MNNELEIQKLISSLIRLSPDYHSNFIKIIELLENNNSVIPGAVDKLKNGILTRDQFFDVINEQHNFL